MVETMADVTADTESIVNIIQNSIVQFVSTSINCRVHCINKLIINTLCHEQNLNRFDKCHSIMSTYIECPNT